MFEKWQDVTKIIAKRDQDINKIGEQFADLIDEINQKKEIFDERKRQLDTQKKINREEEAKIVLANR